MLVKMIESLVINNPHIFIRNRGIKFGIDLNEYLLIFENIIFSIYLDPNGIFYISKYDYSYGKDPISNCGDYYNNIPNIKCDSFEATRFKTLDEATCYLHTKIRKDKLKKLLNDGKIY